jgi:hypothetical protein
MANRDYRAEYARRQATARASGYRSYWHQRQTQQAAADYTGASRRAFISTAKNPPPGITPAAVRSLWAEGDQAVRDGDHERAREIAEQLGIPPRKPGYPPESAFWYH